MRKYKVVGYCHAYPGTSFSAGGETTLHDLLVALVDSGRFDVELILSKRSRNDRGDYVIDGVQVRDYTDNQQPNRAIPSADLVISHLGGAQRSSIIARQNRVPSIHIVHNDLDYTKAMAKHAQFLVYNTVWVLDSFRNDTRYNRPPGIVVRPPVNPAIYEVETSREYITLVNLADGEGGPYNKGPSTFYSLASRLPEYKFLGVVGAYGNQDIRESANVTIVPNTDDIRSIYSKTRVVLSPSNYESYGRISVEAAASAIPSITSTAPGFLEHGVGYRCIPWGDVDRWEHSLRELLNPETYRQASIEAKQKSVTLWEQSKRELKEYVQNCLEVAETGRKRNPSRR